MGVDALMRVDLKRRITDKELAQVNYKLCRAFGRDFFYLDGNDMPLGRTFGPQKEDDDNADGSVWPYNPVGDVLHVSIFWHHYGKGYERGPGHKIILLSRYLERVTGGVVWYGNDSDFRFSVFGKPEQQKMWALFCETEPYTPSLESYPCQPCGGMPMNIHSYGRKRERIMGDCPGCGRYVVMGHGLPQPIVCDTRQEAEGIFAEKPMTGSEN